MSKKNHVRIIGGQWRARHVHFANSHFVRPTPDRVRETLFNWLAFKVKQAVCFDLCAGSGVLGLEALSRGAKQVIFVEKNPESILAIHDTLVNFKVQKNLAQLETLEVLAFLESTTLQADIIFLDPPYAEKKLLRHCLEFILKQNLLKPKGVIYVESDRILSEVVLIPEYVLYRCEKAGKVYYGLLNRLDEPFSML